MLAGALLLPLFRRRHRNTALLLNGSHRACQNIGWGARIRTWEWRNQNPLPYHLATPHRPPTVKAATPYSRGRVREQSHGDCVWTRTGCGVQYVKNRSLARLAHGRYKAALAAASALEIPAMSLTGLMSRAERSAAW